MIEYSNAQCVTKPNQFVREQFVLFACGQVSARVIVRYDNRLRPDAQRGGKDLAGINRRRG